MSAWLVTKEHIDVLVTAAKSLGLLVHLVDGDEESLTAVGLELWRENVKSLRYCYGRADTPEYWGEEFKEVEKYRFSPQPVEDLVYVYTQVDCYDYQSCEHPDYRKSWSAETVRRMGREIEKRLHHRSKTIRSSKEYDRATWGVKVKSDGTLWLDQNEYWAWVHEQREKERVA